MTEPSGDFIDNTLLREAVLKSGLSYSDICRSTGMLRRPSPSKAKKGKMDPYPDTTLLQRKLGMRMATGVRNGERYYYRHSRIRYDDAVKICRAIDAWPVEVGV